MGSYSANSVCERVGVGESSLWEWGEGNGEVPQKGNIGQLIKITG